MIKQPIKIGKKNLKVIIFFRKRVTKLKYSKKLVVTSRSALIASKAFKGILRHYL